MCAPPCVWSYPSGGGGGGAVAPEILRFNYFIKTFVVFFVAENGHKYVYKNYSFFSLLFR